MADMKKLAESLSELSLSKKILIAMFFAGGFALITVLWLWTQAPEFRVLYTNLSPEDAGAVVEKFKEQHIPYQFSGGGSTILVPSEQVHDLRLQLASQGLPQGTGVGFEIFDKSSLGTSEYAQKLNFRRALQGELARTISQLDEVSSARVHLVIPEPVLFSEQQEEARAAVVVNLRPGQVLSPSQIQGITHLISGSVTGLKPSAITIVDSKGQIRSKGSEEGNALQMSSTQMEYQKNLEQELENKIETILTRVVGPNKTVVRVSSLLNFRQVELTEERFDPDTQVVRSEQRSQGQANGTSQSKAPLGIPGVSSNLPAAQALPEGGTRNQNNSQTTNEVINYEISKTVSRVVEPSGTIKQLSVAVMIDGNYETNTDAEGVTTRKYIPRGEEEMGKLEEIVKKTMGYSVERKDQVEVVNISFSTSPEVEDTTMASLSIAEKITQWLPLVRQIVGPLLILLVLLSVTKPILKVLLTPAPQQLPLPEGMSLEALMSSNGIAGQLENGRGENTITKEEFLKLAKDHPQAAGHLVKKWVSDT